MDCPKGGRTWSLIEYILRFPYSFPKLQYGGSQQKLESQRKYTINPVIIAMYLVDKYNLDVVVRFEQVTTYNC